MEAITERRVGVAIDFSECSRKALKWAVDNIVRDGDHLILVTVRPEGYYEEGEMQLWEVTGSPLIPLHEFSDPAMMKKKYGFKPDPETLDIINTVKNQKEIVVVTKIYWGDAREKICEAIDKTPLSCLIIGNRGLGKLKRAIMGSVSNYVVNNGTCPVTVVKMYDHET
ncbi:universal stress protein PHOS32 [Mercurialis annua]|uniref:universal stress protein PHOS32 n=1 Tax=Mercurialis annua TaxID=3986 RepID=UPI00215FE87C|nr:universal stress protein PHOS32 [Mercurialis annua]